MALKSALPLFTPAKNPYQRPECDIVYVSGTQLICDSPAPGANEQISIEDWGDLINNE